MHLQELCLEAELAPSRPVAKQALSMLWKDVITVQSPSTRPGHDAIIARNLIKVVTGLSLSPCALTECCQEHHARFYNCTS